MDKIIKVNHLTKNFSVRNNNSSLLSWLRFSKKDEKKVTAVKDISFEINKGELVGFIGPNGAGKTTTLKCLSGLIYPTSGEIRILNHTPHERKKTYLKKISFIMGQKNQLWWDLPAVDILLLNKEIYELDNRQYQDSLLELVDLLDVKKILDIPVRQLSFGQKMKLELIASLIHRPQVLFMDEPTLGLDLVMQENVRQFIKRYNQKSNSTIIMTSHYMRDVKELCKRIIIIDSGKIIYDGQLDKIIRKYSQDKIITIYYKRKQKNHFKQNIKIIENSDKKTVFSINRKYVKRILLDVMKERNTDQVNIEDPEIDVIIRSLFKSQKS